MPRRKIPAIVDRQTLWTVASGRRVHVSNGEETVVGAFPIGHESFAECVGALHCKAVCKLFPDRCLKSVIQIALVRPSVRPARRHAQVTHAKIYVPGRVRCNAIRRDTVVTTVDWIGRGRQQACVLGCSAASRTAISVKLMDAVRPD